MSLQDRGDQLKLWPDLDEPPDVDGYIDAWVLDPVMRRYYRLLRERGIETAGYL